MKQAQSFPCVWLGFTQDAGASINIFVSVYFPFTFLSQYIFLDVANLSYFPSKMS